MDNTKLFNGIKDVIIEWLVPYTKRVTRLGGYWGYGSDAGALCCYCINSSSSTYSYIGAYLCDNGEIRIWTGNKENINLRLYYNTRISNAPIISRNMDSEHKDFSENDIKNLYDKIKEYLEKNKELVMLSDEEEKGYGKIVEDLTIDDLRKYEEAGISIVLVRKPLTEDVSKAVSESKIHVYANLDPETINIVRDLIADAGDIARHAIPAVGGDSNE